jgi:hypothetical protein
MDGQVPFDDVQVGAADAAHRDTDADLAGSWLGERLVDQAQGMTGHGSGRVDLPGAHAPMVAPPDGRY